MQRPCQIQPTNPDLSRDGVANVEMGGDESEVDHSSGDDSVVGDRDAQHAAGDVAVADSAWDEVIVNRATRAAFARLDRVDLISLFKLKASVMRGAYRSASKVALIEADLGYAARDELRVTRSWKLFLLLPRMLLHKPARGGLSPKGKLKERYNLLSVGRI